MSAAAKGDELQQKKSEIEKESDGLKRAALFLDLLSQVLHENRSLFGFFKVKEWVAQEFERGHKDKALLEKFKTLQEEGHYLKKSLIREGDFAIEQMNIALDDLRESLINPDMGLKKTLLPRILLNIRPKQIVDDLRALRFLSKIRIRLFDFQKELGALNATMSKKKKMFTLFREFSKEVGLQREDLLKKIIHKIEGNLFKDVQKRVCVVSRSIQDEKEVLHLEKELAFLRDVLEAMRLNKEAMTSIFAQLGDLEKIVHETLERQKQNYLDNQEAQDNIKLSFEEKLESQKDLKALLAELRRSSLYIELKKELEHKIYQQMKSRDKKLEEEFSAQKKRDQESESKRVKQAQDLLERMQVALDQFEPTEERLLEVQGLCAKRECFDKRLDCMKFEALFVKLQNCALLQHKKSLDLQEWQSYLQKTKSEYQELRAKGSLAFEESLELNEILASLKESQKICQKLQGVVR
jgi:hypothetical protein